MIRRLREKGQPIRYFGESDADVEKRLKLIETSEREENGMRNDFKVAMEKSEQESLNELMNSMEPNSQADQSAKLDIQVQEDGISFNEILVNSLISSLFLKNSF